MVIAFSQSFHRNQKTERLSSIESQSLLLIRNLLAMNAPQPQGTNYEQATAELVDDLEHEDDRATMDEIRDHEIKRILDCQSAPDIFQDIRRTPAQLKVAYKEMHLLVHPDKNPTRVEAANAACASKLTERKHEQEANNHRIE